MKEYLSNLKTTLFGAVAGLPLLVEGLLSKDWSKALEGLGILLVGIFAKDIEKK
jgi:hypothetical protein